MLGNSVCLALVANKIDLLDPKTSPTNNAIVQEAIAYAESLEKAKHYLTSAKTNQGLQELFVDLSKRMTADSAKKSRSSDTGRSRTLRIQDDESPEAGDQKCSC